MVSSNSFDTSYTIFLYQKFAYVANLILGQLFPIYWSTLGLNEITFTVLAVVPLVSGVFVFTAFDDVFSLLLVVIVAFRVLTNDIDLSFWATHKTELSLIVDKFIFKLINYLQLGQEIIFIYFEKNHHYENFCN